VALLGPSFATGSAINAATAMTTNPAMIVCSGVLITPPVKGVSDRKQIEGV
jgi:hypothetical protein